MLALTVRTVDSRDNSRVHVATLGLRIAAQAPLVVSTMDKVITETTGARDFGSLKLPVARPRASRRTCARSSLADPRTGARLVGTVDELLISPASGPEGCDGAPGQPARTLLEVLACRPAVRPGARGQPH